MPLSAARVPSELRVALLATAAPSAPRSCSIDRTFALLQCRKARRRSLAERQSLSHGAAAMWTAAYLAPLAGSWCAAGSTWAPAGIIVHWGWAEALLSSACALAAHATVMRSATCAGRCCMWWAYVAAVVLIVAHGHTLRHSTDISAVACALVTAQLLTLLIGWLLSTALPGLLLSPANWDRLRLDLLWIVLPTEEPDASLIHAIGGGGGAEGSGGGGGKGDGNDGHGGARRYYFEYYPRLLRWRSCRRLCSYHGELHRTTGRPHGHGEWIDSDQHGECLVGWWEDGAPVGPFHSREVGSACGFVSLRVGFCATHEHAFGQPGWSTARRDDPPLRFGTGVVEASISGVTRLAYVTYVTYVPYVTYRCEGLHLSGV